MIEQSAQHVDRIGQHLTVGRLEQGQLRFDRGSAVRPYSVERAHSRIRDANADRPGIAGVDGSGNQAGVLEPAHLRGHRGLRAVIDGGQITDAGFSVDFDGGQQPGLRGRQRHLDALGGQPIEPRDDGEQVCSQARLGIGVCGVNDIGVVGGGCIHTYIVA